MAKNFKAIYEGGNDSSALNQLVFISAEGVGLRGVPVAPGQTDFLYVLSGGGINYSQPFESSPHRSGRHNTGVIRQKTTTEWSFSTLLNILQKETSDVNIGLDSAPSNSIDAGVRLLWKSVLGNELNFVAGTIADVSAVGTFEADDRSLTLTAANTEALKLVGKQVVISSTTNNNGVFNVVSVSSDAKTIIFAEPITDEVSAAGTIADVVEGYRYDSSTDPSVTMTIFENLDHMAKQASGCFVNQVEISLPGDGQAQLNWSGNGKTVKHAGIGKIKTITAAAGANVLTMEPGDELRFDVGSLVMIVKDSDGVARSGDTATARKVTAVNKTDHKVTIDGAALTIATAVNDLLCYWEPSTYTGVNAPQTGLVGQISIASLPGLSCVRSATVTLNNNHELSDYCYGTDGLSGALFVPGGRLEATISVEMNLNANLVEFMKRIRDFEAQSLVLVCGPQQSSSPTVAEEKHHFRVALPKVQFQVPSISVPETGSVPVTFEGTALQTVLDAADEVTASYVLPVKLA